MPSANQMIVVEGGTEKLVDRASVVIGNTIYDEKSRCYHEVVLGEQSVLMYTIAQGQTFLSKSRLWRREGDEILSLPDAEHPFADPFDTPLKVDTHRMVQPVLLVPRRTPIENCLEEE